VFLVACWERVGPKLYWGVSANQRSCNMHCSSRNNGKEMREKV
jgi:hypothetical protein